jgi:ABC-type nitrate/sulfonate/bicarbonate transport system substrate-binding protein
MSSVTVLKEVFYTICPAALASHVAIEKGWVEEEFKKVGASPRYIGSLPKDQWIARITHRRSDLLREGGNIPAIWAKSEGAETKLIGLAFVETRGKIVVRVGSGIRKVADLRGKRIGLSFSGTDRVDFARATAQQSILLALEIAGVDKKDVEFVDIPEFETKTEDPYSSRLESASKPTEFLGNGKFKSFPWKDGLALLEGRVDAVYAGSGKSEQLEAKGLVTTIEDLGRYPDWTLQAVNNPRAITVSTELAQQTPEIVTAWLKALIKAGHWIKKNPSAAAVIFAQVATGSEEYIAKDILTYDFVPNLSEKSIVAIEIEKKFLLEHGYIRNYFDVKEWVDGSFLEQALKEQED